MRRPALVVGGAVVAFFGAIFSLQGFGVLGGSPMSNTTFWSVAGPIIVLVGLVGVWRGTRGPSA
ncbi:MAG TPA: hypothetical protein VJ872_00860 [Nocardioides sp.]|nr:hypothetical protein [Nocardioides sp.]